MPVYEYQCCDCRQRYELLESIAEMEVTRDSKFCRFCEGKLQKLISTPSLRTDTQFQRGVHFNDGLRNDKERRKAHALARRMGVSIAGKRYDGRLARFPLDPKAFYGDRSEARAAVARTGQSCAELGVKGVPDLASEKPYRVAEDIVERHARDKVVMEHGGTVTREKWNKIKAETRARLEPSK